MTESYDFLKIIIKQNSGSLSLNRSPSLGCKPPKTQAVLGAQRPPKQAQVEVKLFSAKVYLRKEDLKIFNSMHKEKQKDYNVDI